MPIAGRKPKADRSQVRHRNPAAHDWTEVPNVPFEGGPKLPTRYRVDAESGQTFAVAWPPRTEAWWETVSSMPHCVLWTASDWDFALDTAEVHARFVEGGSATELRIREKLLGTTLDARRDLRIRYVEPKASAASGTPGGVVQIDDYRSLYG